VMTIDHWADFRVSLTSFGSDQSYYSLLNIGFEACRSVSRENQTIAT
jgi:hypothetical protein